MIESVRGVLWARKRQPDQIAYAICTSDHLAPWWDPAGGPLGMLRQYGEHVLPQLHEG